MVKIGSDIDGVIAFHTLNKDDYKPFRLHKYYFQAKPTKLSKMPIDLIITGRKEHFRKLTERWLESNDVKYQQLIMFSNKIKKTNQNLSEYKSRVINEFGITKYYEDDKRITDYLKCKCINTKIIFVKTYGKS